MRRSIFEQMQSINGIGWGKKDCEGRPIVVICKRTGIEFHVRTMRWPISPRNKILISRFHASLTSINDVYLPGRKLKIS